MISEIFFFFLFFYFCFLFLNFGAFLCLLRFLSALKCHSESYF